MVFTILSFDVGIKNLSYCKIEYNENCTIKQWGIINIFEEDESELTCQAFKNKGGLCQKKCNKYILEDSKKIGYCGTHLKSLEKDKKIYEISKININKMDIQVLYSYLIKSLDKYPDIVDNVDEILIENQPALKNPRMKTIQVALYTYFYIRYINDKNDHTLKNIKLISASNKLKIYDGPEIIPKAKNKYARNKELSIKYCEYLIQNDIINIDFFKTHKKKDDLADSYLQGLYYIYKKYKLNIFKKPIKKKK